MVIRIYGSSGSRKSYTARKMSKKLKVPYIDLDTFFARSKFNKHVPDHEVALNIMTKLIKQPDVIIEGIYYFPELLSQYDKIIVLKPPMFLAMFRVLKRFFQEPDRGFIFKQTLKLLKQIFRQYFKEDFKHYGYFRYKKLFRDFNESKIRYEFIK
jgi:adenylate kinase family enzyme